MPALPAEIEKPKTMMLFPIALVLYEIATYLSNDMYLPALPMLEHDLHISQALAQYSLLTWFLGSASIQLIMGPLSERVGRRSVLLTGGVFFVISSLVCALTSNIIVLLIARFVQGAIICSMVVPGYATIHELYDSKTAMKVIGIMGSIIVLAPAFGPILGAFIIEWVSWRYIFGLLAVWSAASLILLFKVMPDTAVTKTPMNIAQIIKDYLSITTRKAFLAFILPYSLLFMALIGWIVESPFLLIEHYHKSPVIFGVVQVFVFGAFSLGAQLSGRLIYHFSPVKIINAGIGIAFLGALSLMFGSIALGAGFTLVVLNMMLIAFGISLAFGPLNRLAIESCSEAMGNRMAIFFTFMNVFGVFGTFAVTLTTTHSMAYLSVVIAAEILLAGLCRFIR